MEWPETETHQNRLAERLGNAERAKIQTVFELTGGKTPTGFNSTRRRRVHDVTASGPGADNDPDAITGLLDFAARPETGCRRQRSSGISLSISKQIGDLNLPESTSAIVDYWGRFSAIAKGKPSLRNGPNFNSKEWFKMNLNDIAISAKVLYDKNPGGWLDCFISVELANGRVMAIIPDNVDNLETDEEKIEAALEMEGKTLIEDFESEVNER